MTMIDSPAPGIDKRDRDLTAIGLLALRREDGSFHAGEKPNDAALNVTTQALLTAALAEMFEQTRDADLGRWVRESRDALWADNRPAKALGAPAVADDRGRPPGVAGAGREPRAGDGEARADQR